MLDLLFSVLSTVPLCITAQHPGILHFTLFRKIHFSFEEKRLLSNAELQRAPACLNLNQLLLWCLPLHLLLLGTWSNQFLGLLGILWCKLGCVFLFFCYWLRIQFSWVYHVIYYLYVCFPTSNFLAVVSSSSVLLGLYLKTNKNLCCHLMEFQERVEIDACVQSTIFTQAVCVLTLWCCFMLVIYTHSWLKEVQYIVPWLKTLALKTGRLDFESWLQHLWDGWPLATEPLNLIFSPCKNSKIETPIYFKVLL